MSVRTRSIRTPRRELGRRKLEGKDGARWPLVGDRNDEPDPAPIVDDDLEVVVADAMTVGRGRPATGPMTTTIGHAAELLVVLVEQGARMAGDVADRDPGRPVGIPKPAEAGAPKGRVDGRSRVASQRGEPVWAPPSIDSGRHDRLGLGRRQRPW